MLYNVCNDHQSSLTCLQFLTTEPTSNDLDWTLMVIPASKNRITNAKIYWRCIKYSSDRCHSRLHTCLSSTTILKPPSKHYCKFDETTNELRASSQQVADRAINTQETPDTIITNCYRDLSDPSLARLPI